MSVSFWYDEATYVNEEQVSTSGSQSDKTREYAELRVELFVQLVECWF